MKLHVRKRKSNSLSVATYYSPSPRLITPCISVMIYRFTPQTRMKSFLTFGLVRCCSLLSSLSLCKRSNSSLISAGVLFLSTTCSERNETPEITREDVQGIARLMGRAPLTCCALTHCPASTVSHSASTSMLRVWKQTPGPDQMAGMRETPMLREKRK